MLPGNAGRDAVPATAMGFHTTHWTIVLAAREKDGTIARGALTTLCSTYWYPLYAFIRRQGATPHEAEDLTQEFFFRFVERHALGSVRPAAGKFRSFLLACLKNFLANERERAQAQRRGGGRPLVSLNSADAETRYSTEPADNLTPDMMYERRWAFAVVERTMNELRRECAKAQKGELFEEYRASFLAAMKVCRAPKRRLNAGSVWEPSTLRCTGCVSARRAAPGASCGNRLLRGRGR